MRMVPLIVAVVMTVCPLSSDIGRDFRWNRFDCPYYMENRGQGPYKNFFSGGGLEKMFDYLRGDQGLRGEVLVIIICWRLWVRRKSHKLLN